MKLRTLGPIGLHSLVFLLAAPWSRVGAEIPAALVRHAPTINGTVEGSVRQLLPESVTLNGGAAITEDLLLPGTPAVRLNGHPSFGGTVPGSGAASPANHVVTLSGNARLRFLRTRTDAASLPGVTAPPGPAGTRNVTVKNASQPAGDFATLRNLTLDDKAGQVAVPPGVYGDFTADGKSGFVLGVADATQPATYAFQRLTLNGETQLQVAGPVVVTVANGFSAHGEVGSALHPAWLALNLYSGGIKLEGDSTIYGYINAPNGAVIIDGKSRLVGGVACDQLTINGEGLLRVLANAVNQPPQVSLTSPANGATFVAPASFTLTAMAADADGSVAKVEFYQGAAKLGEDASAPFEFAVTSLVAGTYAFSARACDNFNAVGASAPLDITVTNPTLPPVVTLTAPADDTIFNAPATILLAATASDPDGTIAKVEFFQGTAKLGEVSNTPFEFSWPNVLPGTYSLTAKAYDNGGASTVSVARAVTVQVGLPYFTGFEVADGYAPGWLADQAGWMGSPAATVTSTLSYRGAQSIQLAASGPPAMAALQFPAYAGQTIAFVEFFAQPAAGNAPVISAFAQVEAAHVAFVQAGATGELYALNGDGAGAGIWQPTGFKVALTSGGQSSAWIWLTLREDFAAKRWDLFANGRMVACDLGFVDNASTAFARFALIGHQAISSAFDEFYAGFDNPLFIDADKDGLPDAWERANGLNPAVNDRNGDPDGDGRTNVQEYQAGTAPADYYDGTLPELTSLLAANQQPDPGGLLAVRVTRTDGSLLANAPLAFDAVSGGSQLSATPDGPSYAAHIDVRSDAQGIARTYIRFAIPPAPTNTVQASARSGAQTKTLTLVVVPPFVDTDGDGLPDLWEQQYFGGLGYGASDDPGQVGRTLLDSSRQGLSPWPAPAVSNGLQLWNRADLGVTKDASNHVSQWTDVSGNGVHLAQNFAGAQPLGIAGAINVRPALRFNGSSTILRSAAVDLMKGSTDVTLIVVSNPGSSQPTYADIVDYDHTTPPYGGFVLQQNAGTLNQYGMWWFAAGSFRQSVPTTFLAAGVPQILSVVKGGSTETYFLNGVQKTTASAPAQVEINPVRMFNVGGSSIGRNFNGDIAEVLVYNRALTAAERQQIETALAARYFDDDDSLPGWWELKYLGTLAYGPTDDPGGVGRTLAQSYQQGLSPWPVPAVSNGLQLWYRADLGVQKDAANHVSGWTDVSGNGVHVQQSNAGAQPLAVSAADSRPVLRFNGTSTILRSTAVDLMKGSTDLTLFVVAKPGTSQPAYSDIVDYDHTTQPYGGFVLQQGGNAVNQYSLWWWSGAQFQQSTPTTGLTAASTQILSIIKSGVTEKYFVDGVEKTTTGVPADVAINPSRAFQVGGSSIGRNFNGDIGEVLVYNRALSAAERQQVETALSARYGDADYNGLPDAWEIGYFGHLGVSPQADPDGDGLTNLREVQLGTNPTRADTDGDGVPDGWETQAGSNPLVSDGQADSDGDGLINVLKYLFGGNPTQPASPDANDSLRLRVYLPRK